MTASQYLRGVLQDGKNLREQHEAEYLPNGNIWHGPSMEDDVPCCHVCLGGMKIAAEVNNPERLFTSPENYMAYCHETFRPVTMDQISALRWLDSVRIGSFNNYLSRELFGLTRVEIAEAQRFVCEYFANHDVDGDYFGWDDFEKIAEGLSKTADILESYNC